MSSLADLISSVKSNTKSNTLLQKNLASKRKKSTTEPNKPVKKPKRVDASKDNEDKGPKVVVFDGSVLDKKPTIEDAKAKKAFMSSDIFKEDKVVEAVKPKNEKEKAEEEENQRKDAELHQLLSTSKLLEEYHVEEMTGKERRKHMMNKLETLGAKKSGNANMPLTMHMGMKAKEREREKKRVQDAKDLGLWDRSLKHLYASKVVKKKERSRDPGITNGVGRMKGGTLHIGKSELRRIAQDGAKRPARGGKKRR
ncbi:hypothetical protein O0I10_011137 [Lichtheimia ornata]|uniref:Uncharacterized protein n=1 Tax=Lichtheimia ornata TaxID=688661 RepID=A0AAD7UVD4_9FUNG|nr:uncharacterized protein O0I10_011137 [Lichtheimia ornata]KAJ8653190.1 hypothetical protein O0I10_011137 [Lichtheimia ornata]